MTTIEQEDVMSRLTTEDIDEISFSKTPRRRSLSQGEPVENPDLSETDERLEYDDAEASEFRRFQAAKQVLAEMRARNRPE